MTHILSLFLSLITELSPSVAPGVQRYWPRAPAELRGVGVVLWVIRSGDNVIYPPVI